MGEWKWTGARVGWDGGSLYVPVEKFCGIVFYWSRNVD